MSDYSLDLLVLTETWLTSNHQFWKGTTILNRSRYKLFTVDRKSGGEGVSALVAKKHLTISQTDKGTKSSFEHALWKIHCRSTKITVHSIYHPSYLLTNKITYDMSIDNFTEFISRTLSNHRNNIYICDFNLHVSDSTDTDPAIFNDSIDAMGLYQHVHFETCWLGNILDLLLITITITYYYDQEMKTSKGKWENLKINGSNISWTHVIFRIYVFIIIN